MALFFFASAAPPIFAAGLMTPPLRLLTFDLDDTLFPCGQVVQRANAVLSSRLRELGASSVPENFQDGRKNFVFI